MKELFLQYIWQNKLLKNTSMLSTAGEKVEIINVGQKNYDSGPDFINARIKINNIEWAGNVEIHTNSSDWYNHNHHLDNNYNNVILHVVENFDKDPKNKLGKPIPTIIIEYNKSLEQNYISLLNSDKWIPCYYKIKNVDKIIIDTYLNALLIERLENKSEIILQTLNNNNNNWEETFYQLIAKNFGFKLNSAPFELVAKKTPLKYLAKHKNNLQQIEAILFGQAGFLYKNVETDNYYNGLLKEYKFLKHKFKLESTDNHLWKFMRSRPANFPTLRISQFAALIHKSSSLFSKIINAENIQSLHSLFDIQASEYWNTHYSFGKKSTFKIKKLGKSAINNIIINTITPFVFIYGKQKNNRKLKDKALSFIEQIPPENNNITRQWKQLEIDCPNAFYSQALIQLKNEYCSQKKCINCQIGNKLILNG